MAENADMPRLVTMPLGIVIRRAPGVTRWARWSWKPVAVLPGAAPADWRVLREQDGWTEYHAATLPLELHRKETEAYRASLTMEPPAVHVILRPDEGNGPHEVVPFAVTASAYTAQDYLDSGEELVEPVPAPAGLVAWIKDFVDVHHTEEQFKKRKRRDWNEPSEDGRGDPRVRQAADVYRAPGTFKRSIH